MIEIRGIRCLDCCNLDLRTYPDHAKLSYGLCKMFEPAQVFMRYEAARNCKGYVQADDEIVSARNAWALKNPVPMWQR